MQLETVLVELPTDWEQRPVEGQGEGGKGKGTSTAAFRKADTTGTQRAGRPEPTVKAQGEFGTNWLTWQPGAMVHSLGNLRGRGKQLERTVGKTP